MSIEEFNTEAFLDKLRPEERQIFSREFAAAICREQNRAKIRLNSLELVLTERCNLACDYCFVTRRGLGRDMSLEVAEAALHLLFDDAPEDARLWVTLFGGEPLFVMPFLREVVGLAKALVKPGQELHFNTTSNGTLITHETAAFLAENDIRVLLSIDGTKEHHDRHRKFRDGSPSFDHVMRGLEVLRKYQAWIGARITVTPESIGNLVSSVEWLNQKGVCQFLIGIAECPEVIWTEEDIGKMDGQIRLLVKYYRRTLEEGIIPLRILDFEASLEDRRKSHGPIWGCEAARNKLCVGPDGKIYPCSRFIALNDGQGAYALGDVFCGIERYDLVDDMQDNRALPRNGCTGCEYAQICAGTCSGVNLELEGNIYSTVYGNCSYQKIFHRLRTEQPDLFAIHRKYPILHSRFTGTGPQPEAQSTPHIRDLLE